MKQKVERQVPLKDITSTWQKAKLALAPATRNVRKKKFLVNGVEIKTRRLK